MPWIAWMRTWDLTRRPSSSTSRGVGHSNHSRALLQQRSSATCTSRSSCRTRSSCCCRHLRPRCSSCSHSSTASTPSCLHSRKACSPRRAAVSSCTGQQVCSNSFSRHHLPSGDPSSCSSRASPCSSSTRSNSCSPTSSCSSRPCGATPCLQQGLPALLPCRAAPRQHACSADGVRR